MNDKHELYFERYDRTTHRLGRAACLLTLVLLLGAPFAIGGYLGAMPDLGAVAKGFLAIGLVWMGSSIGEYILYTPMLGAGGSYLAFITGNLIATASLVTILVLALGVALLIPLQPILQAPPLQPAFDSVVPALFGAMAYQYFRGHMNMAVWPLVLMGVLFTLLPSLVANTSMMVLPAGAAAFLAGYLMTKKA